MDNKNLYIGLGVLALIGGAYYINKKKVAKAKVEEPKIVVKEVIKEVIKEAPIAIPQIKNIAPSCKYKGLFIKNSADNMVYFVDENCKIGRWTIVTQDEEFAKSEGEKNIVDQSLILNTPTFKGGMNAEGIKAQRFYKIRYNKA